MLDMSTNGYLPRCLGNSRMLFEVEVVQERVGKRVQLIRKEYTTLHISLLTRLMWQQILKINYNKVITKILTIDC